MSIRQFVNGQAFEPQTIQVMSEALTAACKALGLKEKDDAANRLLATRIIDLARDGIHDPGLLKAAALAGLRRPSASR
jgi:hypothetical protein